MGRSCHPHSVQQRGLPPQQEERWAEPLRLLSGKVKGTLFPLLVSPHSELLVPLWLNMHSLKDVYQEPL